MAIIDSFLGANYAVDKLGFREMTYNYLVKEDTEVLSHTQCCMGRYGEENLMKALKGWKALFDEISEECDVKICSIEELRDFQLKCLDKADLLKGKGRLLGIGPWLFCFPFKVIGLYRDDLWEDSILNDIIMPAGLGIVRGVKKLIRKKSKFVAEVDANMLSEEEGGLLEGMGTTYLLHRVQKKIAKFSKSNVLHINSGLQLY